MEIINGTKAESDLNLDNPDINGGTIDGSKFESAVIIKEVTTPTPVSNYGKIYTKSDNRLYFQDGAGVEHTTAPCEENYGEAYIYNNTIATVIETAGTPIALRQVSEGLSNNFTFNAGSNGEITSFADGTGGTVQVTSTSHNLTNGNVITIRGTTNYNGVYEITVVDTHNFKITATWVVDDGASDWDQGASLTVGTGAAGLYPAFWQMSTAPAAACTLIFKMYINTTPQNKSSAERKFSVNDYGSASSSSILDVSEGDILWLSVQSDDTANITNKHGEFNLRKL